MPVVNVHVYLVTLHLRQSTIAPEVLGIENQKVRIVTYSI